MAGASSEAKHVVRRERQSDQLRHIVERLDARGHPDARRRLGELLRRQRDHDEAVAPDRERHLASLVRRAAELQHLDRAAAALVLEEVAQDHDVVGHELLDAELADGPVVLGALRRDDDGGAGALERARDVVQLGADQTAVGEAHEQRVERVDGDALGADALDGVLDAREESAEVEFADDGDLLTRLLRHVDERPLPFLLPLGDVPAEAAHVAPEVLGLVLEGDEDARLALGDAGGEEVGGEHRLRAAGGSGDERGALGGEPAVGHEVESRDSGGDLLDRGRRGARIVRHRSHWSVERESAKIT